MNSSQNHLDEDRKFFHDIAGPLMILRVKLDIANKEMKSSPNAGISEKALASIQKSLDALTKLELLCSEHRAKIKSRLSENT